MEYDQSKLKLVDSEVQWDKLTWSGIVRVIFNKNSKIGFLRLIFQLYKSISLSVFIYKKEF